MVYAVGSFVYGWDLTHHEGEPDIYAAHRTEIEDLKDEGPCVDAFYGHNHNPIVYLGVITGSVAEWGTTPVKDVINELTVKPEDLKEFADLVAAFDADTTISQGLKDAIASQPVSHFLAWDHS